MLTFSLHVLGYDIWFYISHLLLHSRALWWIHKKHHKVIRPSFTDTYTGHLLESPFQGLGFALPLLFLPFSPAQALAALLFVNVRGLARHDSRTVWLIGNHHLLHHQHFNCNYGEAWIDRLCGTAIRDRSQVKEGLLYI